MNIVTSLFLTVVLLVTGQTSVMQEGYTSTWPAHYTISMSSNCDMATVHNTVPTGTVVNMRGVEYILVSKPMFDGQSIYFGSTGVVHGILYYEWRMVEKPYKIFMNSVFWSADRKDLCVPKPPPCPHH